jgi:hypothetical protein
VKRTFVACRIACVSDDGENALARAPGINSYEITHPDASPTGHVTANDVVDIARVDITPGVSFILILNISEASTVSTTARLICSQVNLGDHGGQFHPLLLHPTSTCPVLRKSFRQRNQITF